MLRILIIEFILAGIIGAVFFRLTWAVTKKFKVTWGVVLIAAILLLLLASGSIEINLIHEFGGVFSEKQLPSPLLIELNRFLGWIVGAGLVSIIVAKRRKLGFEDDIPFKDYP